MRIFAVGQTKRFIIAGIILGFAIGLAARILFPQIRLHELSLHIWLRKTLGYPLSYYSDVTLIALAGMYQIFYSLLGGIAAYGIFKLMNKRFGYTLTLAPRGKRLLGVLLLILLFIFLRIDILNNYQEQLSLSQIKNPLPTRLVETVKYLFLPSMKFTANQPIQPIPPHQASGQPQGYTGVSKPNYGTVSNPGTQQSGGQGQQQSPQYPVAAPTAAPARMATGQELFTALNTYRQKNGRSALTWDGTLANFAQQRAAHFTANGGFDNSKGFYEYQTTHSLGFRSASEVASYSVVNNADGLISGYFAKYSTNTVILGSEWSHVGIGVNSTSVAIILGSQQCALQPEGNNVSRTGSQVGCD